MPAKNVLKHYQVGGYYHLYNRGVEKRTIFKDDQDYKVFLSYIKTYLSPPEIDQGRGKPPPPSRMLNNYATEIDLLCYRLMPNHFHLLVRQHTEHGIKSFMHSLTLRYSMYFNRKYNRVGGLYQGPYKGVMVTSQEQLLYLTAYIHRNSDTEKYSSLPNYLGKISQSWVKPQEILTHFSSDNPNLSYKSFVFEEDADDSLINSLKLD